MTDLKSAYKILSSDETLEELEAKLFLPKFDRYAPLARRRLFLEFFRKSALNIPNVVALKACRDPNDDKFLSLAISASAQSIVTLDKDLLTMNPFRGVAIFTPSEFLNRIG